MPEIEPPVLKLPPVQETALAEIHERSAVSPPTTVVGSAVRRAERDVVPGGTGSFRQLAFEGVETEQEPLQEMVPLLL